MGRTIRTTTAATVAMVALLGLSACHGSSGGGGGSMPPSSGGSSGATGSGGSTVTVKNFMFMPSTLTVAKGTKVTWKFEDSTNHNVKFTGSAKFTSPDLENGKTYSHTFTTPGTYSYICGIHQYMTAKIVVK